MPLEQRSSRGNAPEPPKKLFIKTRDLFEHTPWSRSTIYRYVAKQLLNPTQLCERGNYLFPVDEVEKLLGRPLF